MLAVLLLLLLLLPPLLLPCPHLLHSHRQCLTLQQMTMQQCAMRQPQRLPEPQ